MSGKRSFEEQVAALDALRELPEDERIERLRTALKNRNNFLVAKAADLVREFHITKLTPELLEAFERFLEPAVKSDPQCWAKNALSRALAGLEHQDPAIFFRGMGHIQLEPVWGGLSDTAGTLRATCALALVQCRGLSDTDLLTCLLELMADKDKTVRVEAARAIEQVGSPSASLLLRLRAMIGADEPEVMGACYGGILRIEGVRAISWIANFLAAADDNAAEAALAIAGTHSPEGLAALRECLAKGKGQEASDPWWRSALLSAIALTRQDAALDFLLELIESESLDAETALEAVLRSRPTSEVRNRLQEIVSGNPRLKRLFVANKTQSP